jgi:S1-C subfamily serine protease
LNEKVSIDSVTDNSLAAKIGLKPADVITELAGEAINSRRQINRLLAANANKTIKIKVEREGKPVEIEFKVESVGSDN